jgi:heptosyltransferase-1
VSPGQQPAAVHLPPRPAILLIRLSAIGDVVVTTPVTRALRSALPDSRIAWVVEPKAEAVLRDNPFVDDLIVWDRASGRPFGRQIGAYRRLRQQLRGRRFDVAIDFQGLLRSGLLAWLSGAPIRVGNTQTKEPAGCFYTHRVPRPSRTRSSRQRCLDLLRPLGIETEDRRMVMEFRAADADSARRLLIESGLPAPPPEQSAIRLPARCGGNPQSANRNPQSGYLRDTEVIRNPQSSYACLAPFTTWPHKHWRGDRWAVVADLLRDEEGLFPVFLGGAADQPRVRDILAAMRGPAADLCGRTSLSEAAATLAGSAVVVAVDTGLLHMAAAVAAPLVGLCGASYWPGFEDYSNFRLIREPFPCSPCLHHPICRHVDCMEAIIPIAVLAACRDVTGANRLPLLAPD